MDTQSPAPHRRDDGEGDLYRVLGVPAEADLQEIRRAYRRRVRDSHPDRGGDAAQFQRVQEAFETLGDEATRAAYDRSLRRTDGRRDRGVVGENAGTADPSEDRDAWGTYGRGTFTAGTRGSSQGTERTGGHRPSGTAHLPPVYVPNLSDPEPLSLTRTSQRVHGELASGGFAGLFGGGAGRRMSRTAGLLERHVLGELPTARLFHDVSLAAPERDRKGRLSIPKSAPRAEHVLVCGQVLVVVASLEVPSASASWDGRVLRAAGRAVTVPDVVSQARTLRRILTTRLAESGRELPLSVHGRVVLLGADGSLMSPVVETLGTAVPVPQAAGRAVREIVAALAASPRANVVERHLLAALRDQLIRPDDDSGI